VLRKGGAARKYELDDAVHFIEDLETLENWFIAKDEAGVVRGLAVEEVEDATLALHNLIEEQQFSAGGKGKASRESAALSRRK
jgi:hypothetical protein